MAEKGQHAKHACEHERVLNKAHELQEPHELCELHKPNELCELRELQKLEG